MAELQCFYCGKKFRAKNEYCARKAINAHMRRCPIRKVGVHFEVGTQRLVVRPHSPKIIGEIRQLLKDIKQLPQDIQGAIVTGFLVSEESHKRVFEWHFVDVEETGPSAAGV